MISNLHVQVGLQNIEVVDADLIRHSILNSLRLIKLKFTKEYGEMVLACDHRSWRYGIFPEYKGKRKVAKEESSMNWGDIFRAFDTIRDEVRDNFPYRVVRTEGAEADDIVGVLVRKFGNDTGLDFGEKIVLISGDHDFSQLHRYSNLKQYDYIKKKFITPINRAGKNVSADDFLLEQIIIGDSGDGIPNIMSDDDTFLVEGKRQKTMTGKKLEAFKEQFSKVPPKFLSTDEDQTLYARWGRNKALIDLRCTPSDVQEKILEVYESEGGKKRGKLFNYFIQKKLKNLMETIQDF